MTDHTANFRRTTNNLKLTQEQKNLATRLSEYDTKSKDAYLGAIYVLQQEEYPDRLAHFAYSLRDVIDLLARSKQKEEKNKTLGRNERRKLLQSVIDPLTKQTSSYDKEYQILTDEHAKLSSIAHNRETETEEEARERLTSVECILCTLTGPQTTINKEIDKIVMKNPSLEDAKKLVGMQDRVATQLQIREKLPHAWLPCMIEAGFFKKPNQISSQYLVKCVTTFPKEVANVVLSCTFKNSQHDPIVYANFLVCTLNSSINYLEEIGRKMVKERWYDYIENYLFAEKYVDVVERLYLDEKYDIAIELAHYALKPKRCNNETINKDTLTPIASYWLDEILSDKIPKLAHKNLTLITKLIMTLLDEYISSTNWEKSRNDDRSLIWRSAIEESDQNHQSTIKSIFVTYLRDYLIRIGKDNVRQLKDIMSIMHKKDYWIYRRLEMYTYMQFPHVFEHEIMLYIIWYFDNQYTHHEYYNLIKSRFSTFPTHIKQKIFTLIDAGFHSERFEKKYGKDRANDIEKTWKLEHLEPIKYDLDEVHKKMYSELIKELGIPVHPDYHAYHTQSIKKSKMDPDLFNDKTVEQVFGIVQNYTTSNELFVSDYNIRITFENYVKSNPLACAMKSPELVSADLTMQYALLSGLTSAVQDDKGIKWESVLLLIEHIVSSMIHDKNAVSTDYDPVLGSCLLLEQGLKKGTMNFHLKCKIWKIIKQLIQIGTNDLDLDDYPDNQIGSLNISINNVNGMSFHVLYHYATWCEKHGKDKRILLPEVKQIFDDYLDRKLGQHTISRHTVLGLFFPSFYYLDSKWVKNILAKIRCGKNEWIAFWDGYVNWNSLHTYVFDDLYKWYDEFLNNTKLIQNIEPKQSYNSTICHAMLAYFYDFDNADHLVEKFLNKADELTNKKNVGKLPIERCIQQIGIIIKDNKDDPEFNKQKLINMWQRSFVSQYALDEWFINSPLDKKTTISLYLAHLKKYPKGFNFSILMPIETFCSYLQDYPLEVASCIEILFNKKSNNYLPMEKIKDIVKSLLENNDAQIETKCNAIIEKAAVQGHDWRYLLNS